MKRCGKCRLTQESAAFYKDKSRGDGLSARCRGCMKQDHLIYAEKYPDRIKVRNRRRRQTHGSYSGLRSTAAMRNIEFRLTPEEYLYLRNRSDFCPCCGIEFSSHSRKTARSIDRLENDGPYSKENCACICGGCNMLKSDADTTRLLNLVRWLMSELIDRGRPAEDRGLNLNASDQWT